MSQYPDPGSYAYPPPYGYTPYGPDPQAPARRAGMLMFVLGVLSMLGGVCLFGFGWAYPMDKLPPEQAQIFQQVEKESGIQVRQIFIAMGAILALPALLMLILGLFVRRGGLGSIVTSLVLVGLMILFGAMNLLMGILQTVRGMQGAASGLCIMIVPLALLVVLLVMLIQAARNAGQVRAGRQFTHPYWPQPYSQGLYGGGASPYVSPLPPPPLPRPEDRSPDQS